MRGRKPKPTILKVVAGNPGKRHLNDKEPKPKTGHIVCPEFLSEYAHEAWEELLPELDRLGLLTVIDRMSFASLCQAWAEFRLATETLDDVDRYITTAKGFVISHPCVAQQRSAWKAIVTFSAMFGLDPSSRVRLKIDPDPKTDPLDAFIG